MPSEGRQRLRCSPDQSEEDCGTGFNNNNSHAVPATMRGEPELEEERGSGCGDRDAWSIAMVTNEMRELNFGSNYRRD